MLKRGDIVKSFDFPENEECYMIGRVVSVSENYGDFRAEFIKRVWEGAEDKKFKTDFFSAPLQGNAFGDSNFQRVVVIG